MSDSPHKQVPIIAVDVRMAQHSGIGRYIRETMPRVRTRLPEVCWRWVGQAPADWMQLTTPQTEFREWAAPAYSWREHLSTPPALAEASVRWIPHYNVTTGGRARLMVTVHDLLPLRFTGNGRAQIRTWLFRAYLRRIRRTAARVCVNSQFTAAELASLGQIPTERIQVTPLAADPTRFGTSTPLKDTNIGFVFLGNLKPHKNLETLLAAWEQVAPLVPGRLLIVGQRTGFFTTDTRSQRRIDHMGERVQFTGAIDDQALGLLLRQATAMVLPSLYEGFGLPVLEAMSVGCPVIAANAGALPEVGGAAALYFPPQDTTALAGQMLRTGRDEALRAQLRQAGLARASLFTWDKTAELTAQALRQVLDQV
jgi:glycosyltransferase involved in cell wall biosynthesis